MMKILSHRGYWISSNEKNTLAAFQRSFSLGFGTETDIRDQMGDLVISHDMPIQKKILFKDFLSLLDDQELYLALNIKADGLSKKLNEIMQEKPNLNWFVFDMSIPDMKAYLDLGMPVFTRMSDVELSPIWLEQSVGVWLDAFYSEWYQKDTIETLLAQGKKVCVISPELHGRAYEKLWQLLLPLKASTQLMLCTDYPEKAKEFFFGES